MKLNWLKVCQALNIPYVTRGPSVVRNHIAIKCPFCGDDDPSTHMGLSLNEADPKWGCWRNEQHRGNNPLRLLTQLVGNERKARELLEQFGKVHPEDFVTDLTATMTARRGDLEEISTRGLLPLRPDRYGSAHFLSYLKDRGFDSPEKVAERYHLHYALVGPYRWRIIIPVFENGRVVAFTGRSINPNERLRYKASGSQLKRCLMNEDSLRREKGRTLVLTEGPFDYMKLDYYGQILNQTKGVRITCGFGITLSLAQKGLLAYLLRCIFGKGVIAFDPGAERQARALAEELSELSGKEVRVITDAGGAEDIGAMSRDEVLEFLQNV
jgi:hypothetical protein